MPVLYPFNAGKGCGDNFMLSLLCFVTTLGSVAVCLKHKQLTSHMVQNDMILLLKVKTPPLRIMFFRTSKAKV